MGKKRNDGICPRCKWNDRAPRATGGLRSWCRECESKQKSEYMRTEAGKAVQKKYHASEKGAEAQRRAARAHYRRQMATEAGRETLRARSRKASKAYYDRQKALES